MNVISLLLAAMSSLWMPVPPGDSPADELVRETIAPPSYRSQIPIFDAVETPEAAEPALPTSLLGAERDLDLEYDHDRDRDRDDEPAAFSIGPEGGYLRARHADRGTWFGGVKARLHLARILAVEASITFHQNRYEDNDILVTQYPVQLTAFLYLIPTGPLRVYILGGVGWYYTRVDYRGPLSGTYNDRTEHIFGEHLGAGAELFLGPRVSLDADVRYIFLNPSNDQVIHRDFNYWQIAFGLNFYF